MIQMRPDKEAFERVCKDLEKGHVLNTKDVADVFGWPAVELYLLVGMRLPEQEKEIHELMMNVKTELKTGISHG